MEMNCLTQYLQSSVLWFTRETKRDKTPRSLYTSKCSTMSANGRKSGRISKDLPRSEPSNRNMWITNLSPSVILNIPRAIFLGRKEASEINFRNVFFDLLYPFCYHFMDSILKIVEVFYNFFSYQFYVFEVWIHHMSSHAWLMSLAFGNTDLDIHHASHC